MRADALVDQHARGRRQVLLVQPAGGVDLVEGEQRLVGQRVQRVVDGRGKVVEGLLRTFQISRDGRHLLLQIAAGVVHAVDQVAGRTDEIRRRHRLQLEGVEVAVERRLGTGIADPFAGGQAGTTADLRLGFQQGDLPTRLLQFVGGAQARQSAADDDRRRLFVLAQRHHAEHPQSEQRRSAQPSHFHFSVSPGIAAKARSIRQRQRPGHTSPSAVMNRQHTLSACSLGGH
ncbi:hypothetical protein D3C76_927270 [compost metagenome]